MDYPITIERVEKILGKRRLALVEEIVQDSEVTEIVLKYPYASIEWGETIHIYGHHHFASWDEGFTKAVQAQQKILKVDELFTGTAADYRAELIEWFDSVAEDPNNSNYLD